MGSQQKILTTAHCLLTTPHSEKPDFKPLTANISAEKAVGLLKYGDYDSFCNSVIGEKCTILENCRAQTSKEGAMLVLYKCSESFAPNKKWE